MRVWIVSEINGQKKTKKNRTNKQFLPQGLGHGDREVEKDKVQVEGHHS